MHDVFVAFLVAFLAMVGYLFGAEQPLAEPLPSLALSLWLVVPLPVLGIVLASLAGRHYLALRRRAPPAPAAAMSTHARSLAPLLLAIPYFTAAGNYAWGCHVKSWIAPQIPLLPALITMSPYLLSCAAFTIVLAAVVHAERRIPIPLRSCLRLEMRLLFVPLLPLLAINFVFDLGWLFPDLRIALESNAYASALGLALLLGAGLVLSPFAVRLFWPSVRLPEGPLRDAMNDLAERSGVRCGDIRVWRTLHRGVINACIAGVLGRFRYIFFTDAMLERLDARELLGVFAHELAHAKLRHFVIFGVFGATLLLALQGAPALLPDDAAIAWTMLGACFAAFVWFYFGALSRQLESQADLFAADLLGSGEAFARVLARLGELVGGSSDKRGWRHHSIPKRIGIIAAAELDPAFRRRFERRTKAFLAALALFFIGAGMLWWLDAREAAAQPAYITERNLARAYRAERNERQARPLPDTRRIDELRVREIRHAESALAAARAQPADLESRLEMVEYCARLAEESGLRWRVLALEAEATVLRAALVGAPRP
ncbi:MAG: M48 family metallopeptidase [Planctomycetes bacterium]|nr:M48 family metallopeptidase [Planctomycetota bacterium]